MLRSSRQRDAILTSLRSRKDHPTAEQLFFDLKSEYPALSLATVYRNLKVLEGEGELIKFHTDSGDRFDADTSEHYHFICQCCKKIIDLRSETGEGLCTLFKDFEGEIRSCNLQLFGVCSECKKAVSDSIQHIL
ncbi:MAG: transcriptional repressor [Oscillospiraceae bacterium]|nr:transcriptional repressor [Oscillospiraceae bacterium]